MNKTTVKVAEKRERPAKPQLSIEERIQKVAEEFLNEPTDMTEDLAQALRQSYGNIVKNQLGLEYDTWGGYRITNYDSRNPFHVQVKDRADARAQELLDQIDFSEVTLTKAEIDSLKVTFRNAALDYAKSAVRNIAEERAESIARQILGVPDEDR